MSEPQPATRVVRTQPAKLRRADVRDVVSLAQGLVCIRFCAVHVEFVVLL